MELRIQSHQWQRRSIVVVFLWINSGSADTHERVTYKLTLHNTASSPTNLHTHGLHIVGDGDGDDITRVVQGGNTCLDYTWDIAADHPGGTHWYHPHYHGKTNEQVAGGAFGMIIVEDDDEELSDWASNVENERLLMVLLL